MNKTNEESCSSSITSNNKFNHQLSISSEEISMKSLTIKSASSTLRPSNRDLTTDLNNDLPKKMQMCNSCPSCGSTKDILLLNDISDKAPINRSNKSSSSSSRTSADLTPADSESNERARKNFIKNSEHLADESNDHSKISQKVNKKKKSGSGSKTLYKYLRSESLPINSSNNLHKSISNKSSHSSLKTLSENSILFSNMYSIENQINISHESIFLSTLTPNDDSTFEKKVSSIAMPKSYSKSNSGSWSRPSNQGSIDESNNRSKSSNEDLKSQINKLHDVVQTLILQQNNLHSVIMKQFESTTKLEKQVESLKEQRTSNEKQTYKPSKRDEPSCSKNMHVEKTSTSSFTKDLEKHSLNIILIGNSGVGKTALLFQYLINDLSQSQKDKFERNYIRETLGTDIFSKELVLEDKIVKIKFHDTSGQERFNSVCSSFYRKANCCVLVYDITCKASIQSLNKWMKVFLNEKDIDKPENFPFAVIGNKLDKENERKVLTHKAKEWCDSNRFPFYECTAREHGNVERAFRSIIEYAIELGALETPNQQTETVSLTAEPKEDKKGFFRKYCIC